MGSRQFIYSFEEGNGRDKMLLGGKGANLCEMTQIGLAVPPGFTITTEACLAYLEQGRLPQGLMDDVRRHMAALEKKTGKGFGAATNPLLVSVRSGSAMSMPGMMDTILNLGLNRQTLAALIAATKDARFGHDAHRRFVQLFGKIALGVPDERFDAAMAQTKSRHGVRHDVELSATALEELAREFERIVTAHTGKPFPSDPYEQLEIAIAAVFRSWNGKRAVDYRRQFKITKDMANGTAVNVCTMVFGNLGDDCATGVGFTRNPATGENQMYGEYLVNAQGEDVVAGIRTPKPLAAMAQEMPELHRQLVALRDRLEKHYREVQDFEFTIEKGRLYCLQTRNGKMNARATVITSTEMLREGLIDEKRALSRVNPSLLEQLMVPTLAPKHGARAIARGLAASPGAASGKVVFDADTAEARGKTGEKIILVREETKPEDIHGFFAAQGILTSRGGKTSHAAVVARGMGKPCVSGCEAIHVEPRERRAKVGDHVLAEGDVITIDGSTGDVFLGAIPTVEAEFFDELRQLLEKADRLATLKVFANADTPRDAERARRFGAMGIGLCRTERMFNDPERLPIVQEMILADDVAQRRAALDRLLPIQRQDFRGIFEAMAGLPVTVRLLDPPIHEFLPTAEQLEFEIRHLRDLRRAIRSMGELPDTLKLLDPELHRQYVDSIDHLHGSLARYQRSHAIEQLLMKKETMLHKVHVLHEVNPMLGHRGVRLGITHPEIYAMQIRAILEACAECVLAKVDVRAEIMVPQVCTAVELERVRKLVAEIQPEVEARYGTKVSVKFGSMIEVVRACMRAARLAEHAEFFSFGTNDLTQATFSFSREDAENKFLPMYNETGILRDNPFEVLDVKGVGRLMQMAVQWGRTTRKDLKVGICGEQGGHPDSIRFCHYLGLNYVSCSAPRVPIARLAAAQARLREAEYDESVFA
ncbi:MAG: pyruvate, phosphate dikinase [Planctomycetes bacterium]|nr:pyruvate, phosphate dikinase [Planctomycetota bacterium]